MRGTIYSVGCFSLVAFVSYKLFGKQLITNFNVKARINDEKDIQYLQNLFDAPRDALVGSSGEKVPTGNQAIDTNEKVR